MTNLTNNDGSLRGLRIAFLTANEGVEEVELTKPWQAVEEAGGEPVLLAPEVGNVQAFNHLDRGGSYEATMAFDGARVEDFAGLVLPGGVANPDQLRLHRAAVSFANAAVLAGTPVAAICHAPWTLIEAGIVAGHTMTSWPSCAGPAERRREVGRPGGRHVRPRPERARDQPQARRPAGVVPRDGRHLRARTSATK